LKTIGLIIILLCTIGFQLSAQSRDSILNRQLSVKHLEGLYDSQKEVFYYKTIDQQFNEHEYKSEKFYKNIALIKYTYKPFNPPKSLVKALGIIDTLGNLIIPCVYEEIITPRAWVKSSQNDKYTRYENLTYFIFKTNDSIGLVKQGNNIVYQLPLISKKKNSLSNSIFPALDSVQNDIDYCKVRIDNYLGLFSFGLEKVIVPPKFQEINIYNDLAICRNNEFYTVYNCLNGEKSDEFKYVRYLKNNSFFVKSLNDLSFVCEDIFNPSTSINTNIVKNGIIQYYNGHFIVKSNGKYGIINEDEKTIIPFVYDDIYFIDSKFISVKHDNYWAISNYKHEFLSPFRFIDVDLQNQVNFNNFEYLIHGDTTYFKEFKNTLKKEMPTHILSNYGSDIFKKYVLKCEDGYHLISFYRFDTIFEIDTMWWDNMYIIGDLIGVQRGNKYGYYNKEQKMRSYLKYDGIRFVANIEDTWHKPLVFNNGSRVIRRSPWVVIKNGDIYYYQENSIPFSNRNGRSGWKRWGKRKARLYTKHFYYLDEQGNLKKVE
jgi:hypothetical protein